MKRYPLLDVFRFFCACLIVMIHMGFNKDTPIAYMTVKCFSLQAVPFFFIVSGFFFSKKLETADNPKSFIIRYSMRLLVFYGLWILTQIPLFISDYVVANEGKPWFYIAFLLIRRILFAGTAPFWYLLVLSESVLIAGFFLLHKKETALYWFGGIGLLLGLIYDLNLNFFIFPVFNSAIYAVFSWSLNFLMRGVPYLAIGIFLAKTQGKQQTNPVIPTLLYSAVCITNIVFFIFIFPDSVHLEKYMILYPIQAVTLFLIGINVKAENIPLAACGICRELSSSIYCLHTGVIAWILGHVIPRSNSYLVDWTVVIVVCILIYLMVKLLRITPLYRMLCLK